MTTYCVIIEQVNRATATGAKGTDLIYDGVSKYTMLPDRVFYIVGSDFEVWVCLREGQTVQVTEEVNY